MIKKSGTRTLVTLDGREADARRAELEAGGCARLDGGERARPLLPVLLLALARAGDEVGEVGGDEARDLSTPAHTAIHLAYAR